ncbi:MAG: DNA-3-methyladenine glycosylase 2 family protein [Steroidobacter sp.]
MMSMPPPELCDRARQTKDPRFDGLFFTAVRSTRIFCRPVCPAPTPKAQNIVYFPTAAAAASAGFRPCLRCRPELSPGVRPADATVRRALDLIAEGYLQHASVGALATRVAVSPRHLRRLFMLKLGATPLQVHQTQRLLLAKQLLTESTLSVTQVALAAGFSSIRRFNDAFRAGGGRAPTAVRRGEPPRLADELVLRLNYRPPLDFPAALAMLRERAVPDVERVSADSYERTIGRGSGPRWIRITARSGKPELCLHAFGVRPAEIPGLVRRVRRMFDLDADMHSVRMALGQDASLGALLEQRPGLRLVGAWDGFETAVTEILRTANGGEPTALWLTREIVMRFGEPIAATPSGLDRCFPTPERLAMADLQIVAGLNASTAQVVRYLSEAIRDETLGFGAGQLLDDFVNRCVTLTGMSVTAAEATALRAIGNPDAFPVESHVSSNRRAQALRARSSKWRPWRAYALAHLIASGAMVESPPARRAASQHSRENTSATGMGDDEMQQRSRHPPPEASPNSSRTSTELGR